MPYRLIAICSIFLLFSIDLSASEVKWLQWLSDYQNIGGLETDRDGYIYIGADATVIKLTPDGSAPVFSTRLGDGWIWALALGPDGSIYVTGSTDDPAFFTTPGALQNQFPTQSGLRLAFVARLDSSGNVLYSTLLGGSKPCDGRAIAVDGQGNAVITGYGGSGLTQSPGAVSGPESGPFLVKLDPNGSTALFTILGLGGAAVVLNADGEIYTAGTVYDAKTTFTPGAFQSGSVYR